MCVPFLARSFAKPPKQVQTVCECILIMKGYRELNWKTAKGMMSDPNFLRSLMEMDFDSITQSQVKNTRGECGRVTEWPRSFAVWHFSVWGQGAEPVGDLWVDSPVAVTWSWWPCSGWQHCPMKREGGCWLGRSRHRLLHA